MPAGQEATIAEVMAQTGRQSIAASSTVANRKNLLITSMSPSHTWIRSTAGLVVLAGGFYPAVVQGHATPEDGYDTREYASGFPRTGREGHPPPSIAERIMRAL